MASTLFIALQCFECSTMQVKQKKKNSTKWVCVVCNQKQSVKKVFAQGYKAKELRFFVQSFNISRKVGDDEPHAFVDSCSEVDVKEEVDKEVSDVRRKKRTDWSEYFDIDLPNDGRRLAGEKEDVKIVTEMPNDMFKRSKLNKYSDVAGPSAVIGDGKKDGDELFKPTFSSRSIKKPDFCSDAVMMRKDIEQRNLESERAKLTSKWDAYLINDEGEHQAPSRFGGKKAVEDDDVGEWERAITEMRTENRIVDEEVHPDFM